MVSIPFCGTAQPKALAVFFISVVGAIIGASLVFNQLLVQVPKDERYEGYFNAANYHVFTVVCVILIQCGQSMYNYGGFASKAWKYLGFPAAGILIFWITGTIEPHAGKLSWVSMSYANINALRIGWEAKDTDTYTQFSRTQGLKDLGLTDKYTVVNTELAAENLVTEVEQVEDYQTAFTGVMFLLITLVISGTISNGYYGVAFKGPVGSQGWSKNYQMAVVFSMLSFTFGFVATFVAWSSDAGANPGHPFYETVLGMASYHLIAATTIAAAVQLESRFLAEIGLLVVGFFLLSGPTKLWQMSALGETDGVKMYLTQNLYKDASGKFLESIVTAELDRYRTAVVLGVLQAVTAIYAMIKLLGDSSMKSIQFDATGYRQEAKPWKKNIAHSHGTSAENPSRTLVPRKPTVWTPSTGTSSWSSWPRDLSSSSTLKTPWPPSSRSGGSPPASSRPPLLASTASEPTTDRCGWSTGPSPAPTTCVPTSKRTTKTTSCHQRRPLASSKQTTSRPSPRRSSSTLAS